jgi:ribosomal protein S18 acetylase RimI-like enzyme
LPEPVIRPYRASDRAAVGDVCVRTADNGGDARALYPDPDLMATLFAWPYVDFEPELAHVLDDGERAVGYIVGTADTPAFARRFREEWLPAVSGRFPEPPAEPATPADRMLGLLHAPERMVVPEVAGYPAHLHIDLLPSVQGSGFGRALMGVFLAGLGAAGVGRVHLCVSRANTGARVFYDRLGFTELPVPGAGGVAYLGRGTEN